MPYGGGCQVLSGADAFVTQGYTKRTIMELNEITQALTAFLSSETDEQLWIVDARVRLAQELEEFQLSFEENEADFLATEIRSWADEPTWGWWASMTVPSEEDLSDLGVAALLPLIRLSRPAAEAILSGIDQGWTGHPEALIPTLVNRAGLKIEDFGGTGRFTPPERNRQWYDERTWHWQGPVEHVSGKLHFPVPYSTRPLAAARLRKSGQNHSVGDGIDDGTALASSTSEGGRTVRSEGLSNSLRLLYVSPVGADSEALLPTILDSFLAVGADCWLLQYDDAELPVPDGVRLIRDRGYKFPLALRHLHPQVVADYDFIFFWDDDLRVKQFDPMRFARIMLENRLEMAQPAIQSPHELSHRITAHRYVPPPWLDPNGREVYPVVGRLTNFVEIMAPVFTREAWREFYSYLDPGNRSGWGYDYIPLGRKGIVDAMPVVHARAVQSINHASETEIRSFLDNQGLFRYTPVEMGWLFGPQTEDFL